MPDDSDPEDQPPCPQVSTPEVDLTRSYSPPIEDEARPQRLIHAPNHFVHEFCNHTNTSADKATPLKRPICMKGDKIKNPKIPHTADHPRASPSAPGDCSIISTAQSASPSQTPTPVSSAVPTSQLQPLQQVAQQIAAFQQNIQGPVQLVSLYEASNLLPRRVLPTHLKDYDFTKITTVLLKGPNGNCVLNLLPVLQDDVHYLRGEGYTTIPIANSDSSAVVLTNNDLTVLCQLRSVKKL